MSIDFSKEVDYIARLARLSLEPGEKKKMDAQLSDILDTARRIQEVDTSGIKPTAHVVNMPAAMREDQVRPSLPLNRVLQNVPRREREYVRVPSITKSEQGLKNNPDQG